jgi:hypothetical protein
MLTVPSRISDANRHHHERRQPPDDRLRNPGMQAGADVDARMAEPAMTPAGQQQPGQHPAGLARRQHQTNLAGPGAVNVGAHNLFRFCAKRMGPVVAGPGKTQFPPNPATT